MVWFRWTCNKTRDTWIIEWTERENGIVGTLSLNDLCFPRYNFKPHARTTYILPFFTDFQTVIDTKIQLLKGQRISSFKIIIFQSTLLNTNSQVHLFKLENRSVRSVLNFKNGTRRWKKGVSHFSKLKNATRKYKKKKASLLSILKTQPTRKRKGVFTELKNTRYITLNIVYV